MPRLFITLGILLLTAGLILYLFPKSFSWFGSLPGDIDIRRGNTRIFVPFGSMVVVSLGLTLLINFIDWLARFFR